jgi:hypothetical protein
VSSGAGRLAGVVPVVHGQRGAKYGAVVAVKLWVERGAFEVGFGRSVQSASVFVFSPETEASWIEAPHIRGFFIHDHKRACC